MHALEAFLEYSGRGGGLESRYHSSDTVCICLHNSRQGVQREESRYHSIDTVCMFLDNFCTAGVLLSTGFVTFSHFYI